MDINRRNNSFLVKLQYDDFCEYNIWPEDLADVDFLNSVEFQSTISKIIVDVMEEEGEDYESLYAMSVALRIENADTILLKLEIMGKFNEDGSVVEEDAVPVLPSGMPDLSRLLSKILGMPDEPPCKKKTSKQAPKTVKSQEKEKEKKNEKIIPILIEFSSLQQLMDYAKMFIPFSKESSVIKHKGKFYINITTKDTEAFECMICEHCLKLYKENEAASIIEHGETIIAKNAFQCIEQVSNPK